MGTKFSIELIDYIKMV